MKSISDHQKSNRMIALDIKNKTEELEAIIYSSLFKKIRLKSKNSKNTSEKLVEISTPHIIFLHENRIFCIKKFWMKKIRVKIVASIFTPVVKK